MCPGAKWGREMLSRLLCGFYDDGDLTEAETLQAGVDNLKNNAIRIYSLALPLALVEVS